MGMKFFIPISLSTTFLTLPHQWCFTGTQKVPSSIFQHQPSCIYPLPKVIYYWQLSPQQLQSFLHTTITTTITSVFMSNYNVGALTLLQSLGIIQICLSISVCTSTTLFLNVFTSAIIKMFQFVVLLHNHQHSHAGNIHI